MKRVAVIGTGYIAREHLDCLRSLPSVEVVGVCDISAVMAEATADEFHVPRWFTRHDELLRELRPDVVHVTTPARSHVQLATEAIEAGAHVIVEKPLALDLVELERLCALARRHGRILLEDQNYLFNDAVEVIRGLVREGALGEIVHVDACFAVDVLGKGSRFSDPDAPHPSFSLPGGVVSDFVTHLAYLAYAFVGRPRSVQTLWNKRGDGAMPRWDEFRALVEAERGTAFLSFSARAQPDAFQLRVHGTRMRATASLFEPLLSIERLRGGPRPLLPLRNGFSVARAHVESALRGLSLKLKGLPVTYTGLWRLLERFYASLEAGSSPPLSLEWIEDVNRLVLDLVAQEPKP